MICTILFTALCSTTVLWSNTRIKVLHLLKFKIIILSLKKYLFLNINAFLFELKGNLFEHNGAHNPSFRTESTLYPSSRPITQVLEERVCRWTACGSIASIFKYSNTSHFRLPLYTTENGRNNWKNDAKKCTYRNKHL